MILVEPDLSKDNENLLSSSALSLKAVDRSINSEFQIFSLILRATNECRGRVAD